MKRHKLLSGETVSLEALEVRDIAFLKNLQRMAQDGISFFELERVAIGPGSPALQGSSRVTRKIVSSPLYRVATDIAMRAGIAEGLILAPEHEDERSRIPADRSLISVTQAANTLGISRTAATRRSRRSASPRSGTETSSSWAECGSTVQAGSTRRRKKVLNLRRPAASGASSGAVPAAKGR